MDKTKKRPFSDLLLEAAARVDEMPSQELSRLLMKAAIRLRVIDQAGAKLEHIPVYAYHLLRRLSLGPVAVRTLFGGEDEGAVQFLVSRGLATTAGNGELLEITPAGQEIGEIADERDPKAHL